MLKINSISGGQSSGYLSKHYPADYDIFSLVCINDHLCTPKDPSIVKYVNEKLANFSNQYGDFIATAEDNRTLVVMRDLEQFIGREITWVRGVSFDDLIDKRAESVKLGNKRWLPSWARRYCTEEMKLLPIFLWWFFNIGEKVNMRIGFRFDEFDRMLRFFNNSNPSEFSIPVHCSTKGKKQQKHQSFNWRFCDMPLVKDEITKDEIKSYWKGKTIGGNLFEERRSICFPEISNCVNCFHKIEETLMLMSIINEPNMNWGANQEDKGMGTWLDSGKTYRQIMDDAKKMSPEEVKYLIRKLTNVEGNSCDTGGCTD